MSFVLDASITVARLNKQESTPAIVAVFNRLTREVAHVPALWWLEVANALQMNLKRRRFTLTERDEYLTYISRLPLRTDERSGTRTWRSALALSDRHGLTVYDAAYLELAQRLRLPLATLDRELRSACAVENVALLGL